MQRSVDKAQLTYQKASDDLSRLDPTTELAQLAGCQLVIEAVPEVLEIQLSVLKSLEEHVTATTIIASNTSSIPITKLARALKHRSRFLGMHFFNPVPRMPLVEVVRTLQSAEGTVEAAIQFWKEY